MKLSETRKNAAEAWQGLVEGQTPVFSIGTATCGRAAGAADLQEALPGLLQTAGAKAEMVSVGCIGMCYAEPIIDLRKPGWPQIYYANVTPKLLEEIVRDALCGDNPRADLAIGTVGETRLDGIPLLWETPVLKPQVRIALRNCGIIDPESLDHYLAKDGYVGLEKALSQTPEEVIDLVTASGLRGRGGGGFPSGIKWGFCRKAPGDPKYLICNADEGDPGAFMDRSVLEGDPHAVLEGMCIAAYAIGACHGYVYIRAEYPQAIKRLRTAIAQMKANNLLGGGILGSDFSFDLKIKEGAGAFVCGEETALIASIEGKRGMPRQRPPFPAISGLFGKPTNINNVETFSNVPSILREGADWFAGFGTEKSKGTKTFALTGKIRRSGLIEVPMGITLRQVVEEVGGGIEDDRTFKAAQTGGPSGGCIPAVSMDAQIDFEHLAELGSIMGSGGLVVMDETTCVVDLARYFLAFTQAESCGKCVPCRVGTKQMLTILEDICGGRGKEEHMAMLQEIGSAVKKGSLCGLGQTAPNPALTTLEYFREEYEEHIREGKCRAAACTALITFTIDAEKCRGCLICKRKCPSGAVSGEKKEPHVIDQDKCTRCGVCFEVCPKRFQAVVVQ